MRFRVYGAARVGIWVPISWVLSLSAWRCVSNSLLGKGLGLRAKVNLDPKIMSNFSPENLIAGRKAISLHIFWGFRNHYGL